MLSGAVSDQPKSDPGFSQSIERGLAILSSFGPDRPLMGVSELAREVGLGRSTTHRYVATLAALGYLEQDPPTASTASARRVIDLGFSAINSMELRTISAPYLQRLSDQTGYTANMAILDDTDIIYVERCRSSKKSSTEIELDLRVGSRLPAYCTSMGKVLLAHLPTRSATQPRPQSAEAPRAQHPHRQGGRGPSSSVSARPGSRSTTRSSRSGSARSRRRSAAARATSWRRSASASTTPGCRWTISLRSWRRCFRTPPPRSPRGSATTSRARIRWLAKLAIYC